MNNNRLKEDSIIKNWKHGGKSEGNITDIEYMLNG